MVGVKAKDPVQQDALHHGLSPAIASNMDVGPLPPFNIAGGIAGEFTLPERVAKLYRGTGGCSPPGEREERLRLRNAIARARCSARLTAGWLSNSRDAAAVTLFSSAIAANVIRRFKSTWRSFSKRMAIMIIMHDPHTSLAASLIV